MRAGLDEGAVAVGQQAPDGRLEADGPAQVAVPVLGVQRRGVQQPAGHRGVEGDRARPRGDPGEVRQQRLADLRHLRGVRGVVDGDPAGLDALGGECGPQLVQRGGVARNHGGGRPVDHRDVEPPARGGDPPGERVAVLLDGQQTAAPGERPDGPAAQGDQPGRVVQAEGARDVRGGDLALRVAGHGVGLHAGRAPERGQRDHHGEQGGLHHVHALQHGAVRQVAAAQHVHQRPVGVRPQGVRAGGEAVGEDG